MNCPSCAAELPADARFCVECGAEVRPAATGATTALPRYAIPGPPCPACGAVGPEGADYCVRCGHRLADGVQLPPQPASMTAPRPRRPAVMRRHRGHPWRHAGGPVFLIGLGLLFLLKLPFFPAILVVAGLASFASAAGHGRALAGFKSAFWLFGFALLFTIPRLWVPTMIVLIGLNVLFDVACRAARRP
jgi:hypothetical protein